MLNRKLLEVLNHLTAAELKQLRLFLTSPFFNNSVQADEIVRLYDYIILHNAREGSTPLSKEVVFKMFFPDKQFRKNVKTPLDALASSLFGLVRRFLAQIELGEERREVTEHLALARFYRKFSFEERFWQTMQAMRKMQQDSPWRDAKHYFNQFQIEDEEHLFRGLHNSFEDDTNLNAVNKNLDLYYSILKSEYFCTLAYQKRIAQIDKFPEDILMDSVKSLSSEGGVLDVPINRIYSLLTDVLQKDDSGEMLLPVEETLELYRDQITFEEFKNFKAYIRFLWLRQYRKWGNERSLYHSFDIYCEHLGKGYLYFDGMIPYSTLRNLVIISLKLGEFDWVKNFLDTHPPERICGTRYPVEAHSLNMAEYYFYLKEYEEALERLVYRPFENPKLGILADMILVKIYYETQNDLLDARMKALDQKVRRSRLSQETKNLYYNFLKKLDKIIKYGWQTKSSKRVRLIEEIRTMPDIIGREWLLEKLGNG